MPNKNEITNKPENKENEKLKEKIDENFVIHSMPKKFVSEISPEAQKKSRLVGIMIFFFGLLILFSAFGLFYYFIFVYGKPIVVEEDKSGITATSTSDNKENIDNSGFFDEENDAYNNDTDDFDDDFLDDDDDDIEDDFEEQNETGTTTEIKRIEHQSASIYKNGQDMDGDGLFDLEEVLLDTDSDASDSDNDGYPDLSELQNLYNPAGAGKITDNANIAVYSNDIYDYEIYYPKIWQIKEMGGSDALMLDIGNEQFAQIFVQPNIKELDINEWYLEQFGQSELIVQGVNKNGWQGIKSEDGLIYYLMHPESDFVFTINYNIGLDNTLYYKNIFKMMVDSLEIIN